MILLGSRNKEIKRDTRDIDLQYIINFLKSYKTTYDGKKNESHLIIK